jgi:cytochrome c556
MRKQLALCAAILLATTGGVRADGPNPIEVRQAGMDLIINNFAGIRAVITAKGDAKTLEGPATAMQRWAKLMPTLYPKGSETGNNTRALPVIWSDNPGFQKAAATLAEATGKMAELAKAGDMDGVAGQVKPIGDACNACHRAYRAK